MFNVTGKSRGIIGYLYLVGSIVTFFGYTYALVTLDFLSLTLANGVRCLVWRRTPEKIR